MAKTKTVFFCTNCGNETVKWMGRCPSCGAFNTMEEHTQKVVGKTTNSPAGTKRRPQRIRDVESDNEIRFSTGMRELDRVLGGGAVSLRFCCKSAIICAATAVFCIFPERKASSNLSCVLSGLEYLPRIFLSSPKHAFLTFQKRWMI